MSVNLPSFLYLFMSLRYVTTINISANQGVKAKISYVLLNKETNKTLFTFTLQYVTGAQFHNRGFTLSVNPNNCRPNFE